MPQAFDIFLFVTPRAALAAARLCEGGWGVRLRVRTPAHAQVARDHCAGSVHPSTHRKAATMYRTPREIGCPP